MKKIVDDPRLIFKCCKLYYEEQLSQQQIADRLSVSRVSISRMLAAGREMGMVVIQVVNPSYMTYSEAEQRLEELYGLKEAVVVENSSLDTQYEHTSAVGIATLHMLEHYLHDGDIVGVSMGRTLHNICQSVLNAVKPVKCTFVPTVGGVSAGQRGTADIHANRIALEFAQIFGAKYIEFFAPAMFSDRAVLEGFMRENIMQEILRCYRNMRTVILGVGVPNYSQSSMVKAGYITEYEMNYMIEKKIVGDVSLQFYDRDGNADAYRIFNERVAGMTLTQIQQVENRIAIASGVEKAEAVYGALMGRYINILVTDEECAMKLIQMREGEESGAA